MKRNRLENAPATARGPGRPRSAESHQAILSAAIAEVRAVGFDAVTIEAIAARAGVGKATVYRRWSSKELLVAEALEALTRKLPVPDTGSLRADLVELMRSTVAMYRDPATFGLLSGLVAAMARSKPIGAAVRSGFHEARRAAGREVLSRGIGRGELPGDTDAELVLDVLSGPLFYRHLVTRGPVDAELGASLVDLVLRAHPRKARAPR